MAQPKAKPVRDVCGPFDELCYVCGRVQWGEWVPVGFQHWRHDTCGAGSPEWMAKMKRISRTPLQEDLYQRYKEARDHENQR